MFSKLKFSFKPQQNEPPVRLSDLDLDIRLSDLESNLETAPTATSNNDSSLSSPAPTNQIISERVEKGSSAMEKFQLKVHPSLPPSALVINWPPLDVDLFKKNVLLYFLLSFIFRRIPQFLSTMPTCLNLQRSTIELCRSQQYLII